MESWSPYVPNDDNPWNEARVVHLHRRACFAATWIELKRDLQDGPEKSVSRLLDGSSRTEGVPQNFDELSTVISRSAISGGDASRLKAWWVYHCLFTPDPLGERLTLMWHNHFATSQLKVNDLSLMLRQNQTLRKYARAEFQTFLAAMLEDAALLLWLDAPQNRRGHPNENLAREVMELFSLGIGNYSEQDIREAARALTGIAVDSGVVSQIPDRHDSGLKTILNKTGEFQAKDLAEILTSHPATSRRLAWRLCREFFGEEIVSAEAIDELATGLRANQLRIQWAVETILRSQLFFSLQNQRSRVADPICFLIGALSAFEITHQPPSTLIVAEHLKRMGLDLFSPPNVGGWVGGTSWLSTRTVIARTNAVIDYLHGRLQLPTTPVNLVALLERHGIGNSPSDVVQFFGTLLWGQIETGLATQIAKTVETDDNRQQQIRTILEALLTDPRSQLH